MLVRTVLMDEMLVLDQISACSDVGFSAYFICHSASSSSQKLKSLAFPFFYLFLSLEEIKMPLSELARLILPGS